MINAFLKAKHWLIFILLVGVPLVFQAILMQQIISTTFENPGDDPTAIFKYFKFIPVIMLLWLGVFYGWLWSVGVGLGAKLPDELKMDTKLFKASILFPVIYMLFFGYYMSTLFTGFPDVESVPNLSFMGILFPLHFIAMLCGFYAYYFVAKTYKTALLKRELQFGDFVGEFFLIWFFFIGVWIMQPKINEMTEDQPDVPELV